MRKTSLSSKCSAISSFSARAEARSWPNGFSMISRIQPSCGAPLGDLADERRRSRSAARRGSRRGCPAVPRSRSTSPSSVASRSSPSRSATSSVAVAHPAPRARPRRPGGTRRARSVCTASFIRSRNASSVSSLRAAPTIGEALGQQAAGRRASRAPASACAASGRPTRRRSRAMHGSGRRRSCRPSRSGFSCDARSSPSAVARPT